MQAYCIMMQPNIKKIYKPNSSLCSTMNHLGIKTVQQSKMMQKKKSWMSINIGASNRENKKI